jgi:Mrp family chromosome partitioning ATPase
MPERVAADEPAAAPVADDVAPVAAPQRDASRELAEGILEAGSAAQCVAVFGAERGSGTTAAAVALARALAEDGRVVLVDLAISSPAVAAISREPNAPGIADLMGGTASFRHIITRDRYSRVHLVGAGRGASNTGEILASERLSIALNALKRSYDHVVIDAGALAEAPIKGFAELSTQAVLVAPEAAASQIEDARNLLFGAGFQNVVVYTDKAPRPDEFPQRARNAAA